MHIVTPGLVGVGEVWIVRTIRELREARGWTQLRLAIEVGVTPVTVYNWERGRYEPKASQFRALARALGVSMDDIALPGDLGRQDTDQDTGGHVSGRRSGRVRDA